MARLTDLKKRLKNALKTNDNPSVEKLYAEVDEEYFRLLQRWEDGYETNTKESSWEKFHGIVCVAVIGARGGFDKSRIDILKEEGYTVGI